MDFGSNPSTAPIRLKACDRSLMPSAQIPCVEMISLMALSDLEQLEEPWMALMQSKDPESVAVAFRLALMHLAQTAKRLQIADVIQSVEKQTELQGVTEA